MDGLFSRRVERLVWLWELEGGPGRLEKWTAHRPQATAGAHGLAMAAILVAVGAAGRVGPGAVAALVVGYSTVVYLNAKERNAAIRHFLTASDVPAAARGRPRVTPMSEPKHPALREVYWREEVVEVVLWLRGEGFDERIDAPVLANFLGIDQHRAAALLGRLAAQGYLQRLADGRYELSQDGEDEGRRLTGGQRAVSAPTPGPCGPECWCSTSPTEASRCD